MKEIFNEIKRKSSHMQDLREDKGHAEIVTIFAQKLCDIFKARKEVVIPAAILHDIGYYKMDNDLLKDMMAKKLSGEQEEHIKKEHMKRGAMFAEQILTEVKYEPKIIKEIMDIIKRHDLKDVCNSVEEKIVRDADKLARFSKLGFYADIKRRKCTPLFWYEKLKKNFKKRNYFQTKEAKQIAIKELEKRHKEIKKYENYYKGVYKMIKKERKKLPFRINCEGYFLDGKGNILAKESNGFILFPGGGVNKNEGVVGAMIRETKEETGVIVKNIKKLGTIKIIWGPSWAKTKKQKSRYKLFQGDEMHFFVGDIERFEEPDIKEKDFWDGEKLINLKEVITKIGEGSPSDKEIKEYRETQLKFLKEVYKHHRNRI